MVCFGKKTDNIFQNGVVFARDICILYKRRFTFASSLCMYICTYVHMYMYIYIYIYIK